MRRTDYDEAGFARRFALSRSLMPQTSALWEQHLCAALEADRARVVLDIGTGTGRFWPVLRRAWKPELIVALDRSLPMLRHGLPSKDVLRVCADINALPLADAFADAALCSMSLHYSSAPSTVCARLHRALRCGGVIAVRTGTLGTLSSHKFLRHFPTAAAIERSAMPDDGEVTRWLSESGFTGIVSTFVEAPPITYRQQLRRVFRRGFPSLQMVPRREFIIGLLGFSFACLWRAARGRPPTPELTLLVIGKRSEP